MNLIIGNIIALVSSLLMVYSGILKKKNKILFVQTIQIFLSMISNLVLGGITGAIVNALSCIRNILCHYNKLGLKAKIIITILATILSVKANNMGIIGYFPLISTVVYIWSINTKNVKKLKLVLSFTMVLWIIYDLTIQSYVASIFKFLNLTANLITVYQMSHKKKRKSK